MADDEATETEEFLTAGQRLRAAREEKGFSLEDVAAETRIPQRHLESLETGDWERLPAPTYTIGFAKNYAGSVGLDRAEIADQLRNEMGGFRSEPAAVEHFEPADPARTMPKWLVISAIAAILVVVLFFTWMRNRALDDNAPTAGQDVPGQAAQQAPATPAPQPVQTANAHGPVVLTATEPSWIQVKDQGKTIFEGVLNVGQTYQVPPTAAAPVLKAGKPESLKIVVGTATAPSVGPAGRVASNVSLKPADLMRGPAEAANPAAPAQQQAVQNAAGQ